VITHPEKLLFPADGISKGELAAYYEAVAPAMLPHLRGRPLTMERFPAGIAAKGFMQKDVSKGVPAFLARVEVPKKDGSVHYPLIDDLQSLLWLANQNCVTAHVWTSRVPKLEAPDLCIFDLDPSREEPRELLRGALAVRALLAELELESFVKTSGSKGYHIAVPLDGASTTPEVWQFAHSVGTLLVKRHPELFTQEFLKSERGERILIDTGRNGYGATFAAAYTVRPRASAPVSAPCTWQELERGEAAPQAFTLRTMRARLDSVGDLWSPLLSAGHALSAAHARLLDMLSPEEIEQALAASTRRPVPRKRARSKEG
jgi:bifunctional non-homologous end joining protein LigD